MYIHNFYNDVVLSMRILLDNHLFSSDYIKSYEFNLGNRVFQLGDYETQYRFPNAIISLNDDSPAFGHRPQVYQQFRGDNTDMITALYNITTDRAIFLQEEMVTVPISVQFNCESQLQAKEIHHAISWRIPINKYFQPFAFTSFFELTSQFLDRVNFNPNSHEILNIFVKTMQNTNDIAFCFSMRYTPLIRLDSISTGISDSTQRSFATTAEFTYLIQAPVHLFSHDIAADPERILINWSFPPEPVLDDPITIGFDREGNGNDEEKKKPKTLRVQVISDELWVTRTTELLDAVTLPNDLNEITSSENLIHIVRQQPGGRIYIDVPDDNYNQLMPLGESFDREQECTLTTNERSQTGEVTISLYGRFVYLTLQYHPDDFVLSPGYTYIFHAKGQRVVAEYISTEFVTEENKVIFKFRECDWDSRMHPTLTSPIFLKIDDDNDAYEFSIFGASPLIANIKVIDVTSFSAAITWTSGVPTNTQIEYGETEEYGYFTEEKNYNNATQLYPPITHTHKTVIWGLNSGITYHFRVNTVDNEGISVISDDHTFTTL